MLFMAKEEYYQKLNNLGALYFKSSNVDISIFNCTSHAAECFTQWYIFLLHIIIVFFFRLCYMTFASHNNIHNGIVYHFYEHKILLTLKWCCVKGRWHSVCLWHCIVFIRHIIVHPKWQWSPLHARIIHTRRVTNWWLIN